jgi:16S rRNA (guanine527-N7)-methyltransferase
MPVPSGPVTRTLASVISARSGSIPLILTPFQLALLDRYWTLLARWNTRINLTALPLQDFPDASVDRLLVEPLAAAALIESATGVWFDLGSGGGSPAIPLKIVKPELPLTMVESRARKAAFLREAIRSLELGTGQVLAERAEVVAERLPATADYVTVRAVRPDHALLAARRRLLSSSGRLILFGSRELPSELHGFRSVRRLTPTPTSSVCSYVPRGTLIAPRSKLL